MRSKQEVRGLVDGFAKSGIARGVFTSVADLGKKLRKYIPAYSKSARPFRWTYTDPSRRIRPNKIAGTSY